MVVATHDNATYTLRELDGTILKIPIAGKRIKTFKRKDGKFIQMILQHLTLKRKVKKNTGSETKEDGNLHADEDE